MFNICTICRIASVNDDTQEALFSIAEACWFLVDRSYLEKFLKEAEHARRSESETRHRQNENATEFWGYTTVRPGAHMFYMLYHSYHHDGYLNRSLIIWLQVIHDQGRKQKLILDGVFSSTLLLFSLSSHSPSFTSIHLFPFLYFFGREATAVSSPSRVWGRAEA